MWERLIKDNSCSGKDAPDYKLLVESNPITNKDLEYFAKVIKRAVDGGNVEYDSFADDGGIDIASVLLEEVIRMRKSNEPIDALLKLIEDGDYEIQKIY